jgi:hypothetical protein
MRGKIAATVAGIVTAMPMLASATVYSNASLHGTYSFLGVAHNAIPTADQFAKLGIIKFDGAGNVDITSYTVSHGVVQADGTNHGQFGPGLKGCHRS